MKTSDILKYLDSTETEYSAEKTTELEVEGFSSLFNYKDGTLTFTAPERSFGDSEELFRDRRIAFMIIGKDEKVYDCFDNAVRVENPRKVFFSIIDGLFDNGDDEEITCISSNPDVYRKNSFIAPSAVIGKNVKIGVGCVIEGNVVSGDDTEIHHNVVIRNKTVIGSRCTLHSGAVIGEYGFGSAANDKGGRDMLKHYGGVRIGDDVHIGDNSVIIRGAIDDTVIENGVKLNTMVHVAHNDVIGDNTMVTAPTHFCGSVKVGKGCHIAGLTVRNQRTVGDGAMVGLGGVVVKDVEPDTVVVGNPAKFMRYRKK